MPSFTMELWRVIDLKSDTVSEDTWLRLDTYPIFDETYRAGLNAKIKNHFMYREIGQETVDQFTFMLGRKLNEIMPYYNKLYDTEKITFDPLSTVDMSTISSGEGTAHSTSSSTQDNTTNTTTKAKNVVSAFPQVQLSPDKDYATNGSDANSQTDGTGNATDSRTGDDTTSSNGTTTTSGYQGPAAELLTRFRDTLLNIDMMVIGELEPLFMQVWNSDDSYTTRQSTYHRFGGFYY